MTSYTITYTIRRWEKGTPYILSSIATQNNRVMSANWISSGSATSSFTSYNGGSRLTINVAHNYCAQLNQLWGSINCQYIVEELP